MINHLKVFWQYRHLLRELVIRDIKVKYQRSVLGVLWTVLNPLLMMIILTIVFSSIFRFNIEYYPVYVLLGNIVFNFFANSTRMSVNIMVDNAALLKKVYIPKYLFPMALVCSGVVNFLFSLIAMFIVLVLLDMPFYKTMLFLGIPFFYLFLFTLGISMIISAFNVLFRDIMHLYGVMLTAWSYMTPLFYPVEIIPDGFRWMITINPLYYYVNYFRELILHGTMPGFEINVLCFVIGGGTFLLGAMVFMKLQNKFILYI